MITLDFHGTEVALNNGQWTCADPSTRAMLESLSRAQPDTHWYTPNPDYRTAAWVVGQLGGEIVTADVEDEEVWPGRGVNVPPTQRPTDARS
jgi:hypothetical protein